MFKLLAFLLILCILFGVEATRAFIFGTVGFIFWVVVAIVGFCLLVNVYDELRDKRTPEQKAKDKEIEKQKNKEAMAANKKALIFWGKMMVALIVPTILVCLLLVFLIKK
jgi:Na+/melibiose symporter-like transporter